MRKGVLLAVAALLVMAGPSLAGDQIGLKSRKFVPQAGITPTAKAKLEAARGGKAHLIIQLNQKVTRGYKKSLESQGVKLLAFIPPKAWFAVVDSSKTRGISSIPGIRAVCEILPGDKIAPSIRRFGINDVSLVAPGVAKLLVMFFEDESMAHSRAVIAGYGGRVVGETRLLHGLIVHLKIDDIQALADEDCVKWIDQHYAVGLCNDRARSAVRANTVQEAPYGLSGEGVVVGIWDAGPIANKHSDLERVKDGNCPGLTLGHAIGVAGTLLGDGSIDSRYKGIAPEANGVAYLVQQYEYAVSKVEHDYRGAIGDYNNIDVSNNSWGRICCNWPWDCNKDLDSTYDWDGAFYDEIVLGGCGKKISVIFSSGNEANDANWPTAPWTSLRPNAVAKNVIAVGASNSWDDSVAPFSGRGPTADGRIKPDLVAPGIDGSCTEAGYSTDPNAECGDDDPNQYIWTCWPDPEDTYAGMNGTSMAAPVVSGCIALMLEQWRTNHNDPNYLPLPSTIKAVLIQTAKDLTSDHDPCCSAGPDYSSGYGLVDVKAAVDLINADANDENIIIEDSILDTNDGDVNDNDVFEVNVPADQNELRITLVWDDYPGNPPVAVAWVNDLDLIVKEPNGTQHYPWTLDPCNPAAPADQNEADRLNNVEQVVVDNPVSGIWTVEVKGYQINQTDDPNDEEDTLNQPYSLVTNELPLVPQRPASGNFIVKNSSGDAVAWFDRSGSLVLKGSITTGGTCTASSGSFILKDSTSDTVGYIDNQGNLCIEEDYLSVCGNCNPTGTAFVVRNIADVNSSCIDFDGNLCLMGGLYEDSIP